MSSKSLGSTSQAAPWGRLRAWINEKEDWERQHETPAPLSPKELTAIANLVSFIPEPDVSDQDYVGTLLRTPPLTLDARNTPKTNQLMIGYAQARQLERPVFTDEGPVDITVNGLTESRWRCYCSFPSVEGRFPHVGQGFEEGEEPPVFRTKKVKTERGPLYLFLLIHRRTQSSSRPSKPLNSSSSVRRALGGTVLPHRY